MSSVDEIVNQYVDTYGEDAGLVLLKVLALPATRLLLFYDGELVETREGSCL